MAKDCFWSGESSGGGLSIRGWESLTPGSVGNTLTWGWWEWMDRWGTFSPDALPFSPLCQAVAQTMDSVFKELLGKTSVRQGLGTGSTNSPSPGPRSPKPPASSRLGKNKGFSRGPGAPASPSASHPQGLDSPLKPH